MASPVCEVPQRRHIVLYDDTCPVCQGQMRLWMRLDWFHRLDWRPLNHPEALTLAPGLTRQALESAMHCLSRQGTVYRGARAFRFMATHIPLLAPLALLLCIPGGLWIAERLYAKISRHRQQLSRWFTRRQPTR